MQLMSWTLSRLGSRSTLLFEPYHRRVMHSALGHFLDEPLDLAVGLVEPDGTALSLPFTADESFGSLYNPEQFDRINSITFRGYSAKYRLRFEFNVHSVFYPQNRRLCLAPVFFLEMRVNPVDRVRNIAPAGPTPREVTLFLRLRRPGATLTADVEGRINLGYDNPLSPSGSSAEGAPGAGRDATSAAPGSFNGDAAAVSVQERIVSLNAGCEVMADAQGGAGLALTLPVTDTGSGTKWRLVWGSHVGEPVLDVKHHGRTCPARLAYTDYWPDVDAVLTEAVQHRDDWLALSRRFEKLIDQAPLDRAQQHLLSQSFQNYLANTFWCTGTDQGEMTEDGPVRFPWFSVWEGSSLLHSPLDVAYNNALFALTLWPDLLKLQLSQWVEFETPHRASEGSFLAHDMGAAAAATGQRSGYHMEVEENSNYLLLLQAYTRWTGDRSVVGDVLPLIDRLVAYLLWADRDGSGFATEGTANTLADGPPAVRFARKQTYLAVKRLAALRAAADLLRIAGHTDLARPLEQRVEKDTRRVDDAAWLGDHYAIASDDSAMEMIDPDTGKPLPYARIKGTDAYSIHTGNGLLLPAMIGHPLLLDHDRVITDLLNADRETQGRYADGHSSEDPDCIRISLNLWRDMLARYLGQVGPSSAQQYWDLQVMSNTGGNSLGYCDAYVNDYLAHYPRGIVTLGYFLATPRLTIDRLSPGGAYITVEPDRHMPQRWPLLPLADWPAGKVPVCVVDPHGHVTIEAPTDRVIIHGDRADDTISGIEFIG